MRLLASLVLLIALAWPAAAQPPPPAPQLEDRFGGWVIQCTIDAVALFPSCVVTAEQAIQSTADSGSSLAAASRATIAVQLSDASGEPQLLVRATTAAPRVGVRFDERIGRYLECSTGGVCAADGAAVVNALRDASGQVSSVYLWLGVVREPWLRVSGIGLTEALDCRRKFFAAAAAGRITPVTSRMLTCQGL
jgi:hypothetical protein